MKNNYGNYVVQKVLKIASNINKYKLIEIILLNLDKIGDKKLILKWIHIVKSQINPNDDYGKKLLINYNIDYKHIFEDENYNSNCTNNNLMYHNTNHSKNSYNLMNGFYIGNNKKSKCNFNGNFFDF